MFMIDINFLLGIISGIIILILVYIATNKSINESNTRLKNLVAIAIGIMLTILSLHLLPTVFHSDNEYTSYVFLIALLSFYIIGWLTHNHDHDHQHNHNQHSHPENKISKRDAGIIPAMLGIGIHSFADGIAIGIAYHISIPFGIALAIAIAIHHIPQMSGSAMSNRLYFSVFIIRTYTLLTSSFILIGIVFTFLFLSDLGPIFNYLIAISAASFIYIGGHDLVTYLKEVREDKIINRIFFVLIGVVIGLFVEHFTEKTEDYKLNNDTNITYQK